MSQLESAARVGRPSRYPATVKYSEDVAVHELMHETANRNGLSFSEVQRIVNRAGLQALRLMPEAA